MNISCKFHSEFNRIIIINIRMYISIYSIKMSTLMKFECIKIKNIT